MLGILLDLLAGVVAFLSLMWFGWLGVAGLINPRLVGGRSRLGLIACSVFGCAVSLYLMDAMSASEPEPEPELAFAPAPPPDPRPPPPPPDPPDTTWIVESGVVAAAGDRELLRLAVTCRAGNWMVVLGVVGAEAGAPVRDFWRWDGDSMDFFLEARSVEGQEVLTTMRDTVKANRIVGLLRSRTVLELGVRTTSGHQVEDVFGLDGAPAALDSLDCVPPPPAPSYDLDTEAGIVATLVQSGIGSSVDVVLSMMAGYDPTASRRGEDRLFTYRFGDGSGLVLVFRSPGGPGTGLVLEDIIVR